MLWLSVNRYRNLLLVASAIGLLLAARTQVLAAAQADPIAQCSEGMRLATAGDYQAAVPLLRAGFAEKDRPGWREPADMLVCALELSVGLHKLGEPSAALAPLTYAHEHYRSTGDNAHDGAFLTRLGEAYQSLSKFAQAQELYEQALGMARERQDRRGEATLLNKIGESQIGQGQFARALASFEQALPIAFDQDDDRLAGAILNNRASVFQAQNRFEEALAVFRQSLAFRYTTKDLKGQGVSQRNIGSVLLQLGRLEEATSTLAVALRIATETKDHATEAGVLNAIGAVYLELGQHDKALDTRLEALKIARASHERAEETAILQGIGLIYQKQGRLTEALDNFQQALAIAREIGDQPGEMARLNNIGAVYFAQKRWDSALETYTQAMDLLEILRAGAGSEAGRIGFAERYADMYVSGAISAFNLGQHDLAFAISERGRARAFLDTLASNQVQLADATATSLLFAERETYAAHLDAQKAFARAIAEKPLDIPLRQRLAFAESEAEKQHRDALAAIERRNQRLAALVPGRSRTVLDRTTVQHYLDQDTTLVSYFLGPEQTLAFILTRERFHALSLPASNTRLRDMVSALRISRSFVHGGKSADAVALYTALVAPLKPYLATSRLVIVPHQVLHYLPFAALGDGRRYLIDDFDISILPSTSTLPFIQPPTGYYFSERPFIVGNPDGSLPFATSEAQMVGTLYGAEPLLGAQATKQQITEQAWYAGIVHIASHGRYDDRDPLASSLTLAPAKEQKDSQLTTADVYRLDLRQTQIIVLSACETNVGQSGQGDEIVGLTRAFFFAGAPTVVASLWKVDDKATALLMERFYTHLRARMSKAAALRLAQQEVRASYPGPYYWAGFVLSGETSAIRWRPPWGLAALGSAALGLFLPFNFTRLMARRTGRRSVYGYPSAKRRRIFIPPTPSNGYPDYGAGYPPQPLLKRLAAFLPRWPARQPAFVHPPLTRRADSRYKPRLIDLLAAFAPLLPARLPIPTVRISWRRVARRRQPGLREWLAARLPRWPLRLPGPATQLAAPAVPASRASPSRPMAPPAAPPPQQPSRPAPATNDLLAALLTAAPQRPAEQNDLLAELLAGAFAGEQGGAFDVNR